MRTQEWRLAAGDWRLTDVRQVSLFRRDDVEITRDVAVEGEQYHSDDGLSALRAFCVPIDGEGFISPRRDLHVRSLLPRRVAS